MDSQPPLDDHLADIVDDEWRQDQLPHEQIYVPSEKLPDPEADNGDSHLTLLEQEQRWTDLLLANLTPELAADQINVTSA